MKVRFEGMSGWIRRGLMDYMRLTVLELTFLMWVWNARRLLMMTPRWVSLLNQQRVKKRRYFEQRCVIKFCVILNKFTTETLDTIGEAYNDETMCKTSVFWVTQKLKDKMGYLLSLYTTTYRNNYMRGYFK